MPKRKAKNENQVRMAVGDIRDVSGEVNIAGGDIYKGYTVQQVSVLLTQITSTLQPKPFDGRCPYKGLEVFEEDDADLFFGRERLVDDLVGRLEESRTVFITGPSGSGKSSLVRAGLIHALKRGAIKNSGRWLYETMKPGREPMKDLALAFSRLKSPELADYFQAHAGETDVLNKCAESVLSGRKDQRFVLFIDQFEEVFTQINQEEERLAFLNLLAHAGTVENGRVIVLFAMRSDFVSNCAAYPALNDMLSQEFRQIGAMQPDELVSAIALPARHVGLPIEDELIARIINDMKGEPGALPLMQFALKDLFDSQQEQGGVIALTLKDYLKHGGIHKSLERHADNSFAKLSEGEQQLARSIFSGLIEIGRGTSDTRRTALFDELVPANAKPEEVLAIVGKLADARLIITDEQAGKDTVTISHEKLIEAWPWLQKLVNENRDVIALQNEISADAKEWEDHQRDASYVYTGARLANAREQLGERRIVLSELAQLFVDASIEAEDARWRQEEQRRQKELDDARRLAEAEATRAEIEKQRAEEQTRSATKLRQGRIYLIWALAGTVLLAVIAGVFGVQARRAAEEARRQSERSLARELAAVSIGNLDLDPDLSLHLAMQSIQSSHTLQGEDALRRALLPPPVGFTLHGHSGSVYSVAYDLEGKRLVTASQDGTARIWDAVTGHEVMVLRGDTAVNWAVFSPDGQLVATAGADKTVRIWDAKTGQQLRSINKHSGAINSVAFSPDGQYIVTASDDKTARVWEVASGDEVYTLDKHTAAVRSAIYSPNGELIVTGGHDATIHVWDATSGELIRSLPNYDENVNAIAFSPDSRNVLTTWVYNALRSDILEGFVATQYLGGHTFYVTSVAFNPSDGRQIVTASRDHTVRLWDTESGNPIAFLRGHSETVNAVTFDPSGDHLATASEDQTVKIWNIAEWRKRTLIGHTNFVLSAAYSFDGRRIATTSQDGTIRTWDAGSGRELKSWRPDWITTRVTFSPDDRQLISASDDGIWRIWDADTGEEVYAHTTVTNIVHDARFSPDGTRIITSNRDRFAYIWDADTKQRLHRLEGHTDWVASGMFSPDGKLVATASADGTARVWDAQTGKEMRVFAGHSGLVVKAAFSYDGKRIVTASVDGTARIWDIASGKVLHILKGHTAEVSDAAFSPDNKYVATASRDHTARLWNADTGAEIIQLFGHTKDVMTVTFSPDGRYLLTASYDYTARIYPVYYEDVLELAQSLLSPRQLTCAERLKYLHEVCPTSTSILTSIP